MKKQRGAALIVVLSLLAMSLMLGLSGIQSSLIDERLAGNYRSSSLALMAAEQGASVALSPGNNIFNVASCSTNPLHETSGVISSEPLIRYRYSLCKQGNGNLFELKSIGEVVSGDHTVRRHVHVNYFRVGGLFSLSPITLPGHIASFKTPNSNAFEVQGEVVLGAVNPAISTAGYKAFLENKISSNRMDNYKGGIEDEVGVELLERAADFHEFVSALWKEASAQGRVFTSGQANSADFGSKTGSADDAKLTFVDGNFSDGGNFSGSGVLVVNGDATFKGTPSFDGLIIVLGDYTVAGGGGGQGAFNGSIMISPYSKIIGSEPSVTYQDITTVSQAFVDEGGGSYTFSSPGANIDFTGGGNAKYTYDFNALNNACIVMKDACKLFDDPQAGESAAKILSWKEML